MEKVCKQIERDYKHINSLLVMRNGKIRSEHYYNGYTKDTLQKSGCIFKSFLSAGIGVLVKQGYIKSLDIKVVELFPDVQQDKIDERMKKVTLRHVVTKATGIEWLSPMYYNTLPKDKPVTMEHILGLHMKSEPGTEFDYKPDPQIVVHIIEAVTRQNVLEYLDENLLKQIGIKDYAWNLSIQEIENLKMTASDYAKFGQLYLQNGMWDGKRVLDEKFLRESITAHTGCVRPEMATYGYLWWVDEIEGTKTFYASGFGGQYLVIVPQLKLVSVITSKMDRPHPENKNILKTIIQEIKRYS